MSLGEMMAKLRKLSPLQGFQAQQLGSMGLQAIENTFFHIGEASLQSERRIQSLLDRGFDLTQQVKEATERMEQSIDTGLSRWETVLGMLISPLVRGIRVMQRFLSDQDDEGHDKTQHPDG